MKIVQNTNSILLNSYIEKLTFIDSKVAEELSYVSKQQIKPSNGFLIVKLFNIYCYLYGVKLNYLIFKNHSNKELFTDFLNFC